MESPMVPLRTNRIGSFLQKEVSEAPVTLKKCITQD